MANETLPSEVREALAALTQVEPMRRGSLSERYMRCGKPRCPCADRPEARHGPYFSLTRAVAGLTRSRLLSASHAEIVRRQVEAGQNFRERLEAYWQACERWADAQLEGEEAASKEEAKKGASKRPSRRRLPRRSKR